jgi:hypothetical protein
MAITTTTTALTHKSAEGFMNYLVELQNKFVESIHQQFCDYFASNEYAHVAALSQKLDTMRMGTDEYTFALEAFRSAENALPLQLFADGVEVDMTLHSCMDYASSDAAAQVFITLIRAKKLMLIEVVDYRDRNEKTVFSELVSLPSSFYKFLRNEVCNNNKELIKYLDFMKKVKVALRGDALCVFDRAAKLRALQQVIVASPIKKCSKQ